MNRGSVALLSPSRRLVEATKGLGLEPILILSPEAVKSDWPLLYGNRKGLVIDPTDCDAIVTYLSALQQRGEMLRACIATTELGLLPAAIVSDRLMLPSLKPAAVLATRDKLLMRETLRRHAIPGPAFFSVSSREECRTIQKNIGSQLILKPRFGMGSQGVVRFQEPSEIEEIDERVFANGELLLEEYVEGEDYSAESFSFHGQHVILGITRKRLTTEDVPNPFLVGSHEMPAIVSTERRVSIVGAVERALNALGVTDGPTHTEVRVTKNNESSIIETHTRMAGSHISELLQIVHGIDIYELTIEWWAGIRTVPISETEPRRHACVRFYHGKRTGRGFGPIPGETRARLHPGVVALNLREGLPENIRPGIDFGAEAISVITEAQSPEQAMARAVGVIEMLTN